MSPRRGLGRGGGWDLEEGGGGRRDKRLRMGAQGDKDEGGEEAHAAAFFFQSLVPVGINNLVLKIVRGLTQLDNMLNRD